MPKVSSSAIKRIEYDAGLRKLLVIFLETGAYTYLTCRDRSTSSSSMLPRKASSLTTKSATDIPRTRAEVYA